MQTHIRMQWFLEQFSANYFAVSSLAKDDIFTLKCPFLHCTFDHKVTLLNGQTKVHFDDATAGARWRNKKNINFAWA